MDSTLALKELFSQFKTALKNYDKRTCIRLVKDALNQKSFTIPEIYEGVLAKSLYDIASNDKEQEIGIWQEHIQSGIVRTVIESSYPYLLDSKGEDFISRPVAMVFCPEEEYHELGARMCTDFLTIIGFNSYFIGANTPKEEAFLALKVLKPVVVSISVTNFYHLSRLQELIDELKGFVSTADVDDFKILLGGYAIDHTPQVKDKIKVDYFIRSFEDLLHIKENIL